MARLSNDGHSQEFRLDGLQAGPGAAESTDHPSGHENGNHNKCDGDAGGGPRMLRQKPGETDGDAIFAGAESDVGDGFRAGRDHGANGGFRTVRHHGDSRAAKGCQQLHFRR